MPNLAKTCRNTGKEFVISEKDQVFYKKLGVPLPTLCPEERQRRRLSWRNENVLYKSKSALSEKTIISM